MEWLADRFFRSNGTWVDAASGAQVRILLEPASDVDALDWEEQCARLSRLRHPALNPLLDYGPVAHGQRFEAYARLPALPGGRPQLSVQEHARRFLCRAGITMDARRAAFATREVTSQRGSSSRALGVTLQPRRALDAVQEVLEGPVEASTVTTVVGPTAAGLRTVRTFVARSARLAGFIPVCPAVLVKHFSDSADVERHFWYWTTSRSARGSSLERWSALRPRVRDDTSSCASADCAAHVAQSTWIRSASAHSWGWSLPSLVSDRRNRSSSTRRDSQKGGPAPLSRI